MSKLPGHRADKGEGPNRHKKAGKRNNKRKAFSSRDDNKRTDDAVKFTPSGQDRGRQPDPVAGRGDGRKDDPFIAHANGDGNQQKQVAAGQFRKRDDRPDVDKRVPQSGNFRHAKADAGRNQSRADGAGSAKADHGGGRHTASGQPTDDGAPSGHPKRRHKNRNRKYGANRGGDNRISDEERLARSLRQPVQKAPDAAYEPPRNGRQQAAQALKEQGSRSSKTNPTKPGATKAAYGKAGNANSAPGRNDAFRRQRREPYAALDLGTNNCRLLVALPQERGRFRVIDGFSRIVRLGEGLGQNGRLSDEAMDRALEALRICSEKLIGHNIRRHRLIATEACRQAENGQHFLDRVRSETGMKLEIINRQTEAFLAAEGCGALMDRKADAAVLFDIGGGSSELILVNRRHKKKRISDQIASWTSLPVGVVTLAERHGGKTVDRAIFTDMVEEVKGYIDAFPGRDDLSRMWRNGRVHLLGTSGTVTTLAGVHLGLPRYERRLVDGLWLNSADIDRVMKQLLAMTYDQRAASPCVGKERADLVMAGCAILEAIRQTWPSEKLRVADRGLREGILTQMMERDAAWLPPKANRWRRGRHPDHAARPRPAGPNNRDQKP